MPWYWKALIFAVAACALAGFLCYLHERKRDKLEKELEEG